MLSKEFHHQTPAIKEALLGEYSAQVRALGRRPITDGEQIAAILEHGDAAVEVIAKHYRLNSHDVTRLINYLEDFGYYISDRLETPAGMSVVEAKAAAVALYQSKFENVMADVTEPDKVVRSGCFSNVYQFELDEKPYIARRMHGGYSAISSNVEEVDKHFEAAIRVKTPSPVSGLEQIEAVSYTDDITIAPYIPGTRFRTAAAMDTLDAISDDSVVAMYDAMKQGEKRGITFDGNGPNLIVGPNGSLHWVDLSFKAPHVLLGTDPERAVQNELMNTVRAVGDVKTAKKLASIASICLDLAPQYGTPFDQQDALLALYAHMRNIVAGNE